MRTAICTRGCTFLVHLAVTKVFFHVTRVFFPAARVFFPLATFFLVVDLVIFCDHSISTENEITSFSYSTLFLEVKSDTVHTSQNQGLSSHFLQFTLFFLLNTLTLLFGRSIYILHKLFSMNQISNHFWC